MSENSQLSARRRIAMTVFLAITCGAFAGNLVGGELLDLADGWQTVLWVAGALAGGTSAWSGTSRS